MSVARHHSEWLQLVEVSGPFLSMPVLLRTFPQELDARDPERAKELRLAHAEWLASQENDRTDRALHHAWIRHVLTSVLELPEELLAEGQAVPQTVQARVAEQGETLRPDIAILEPAGREGAGRARILCMTLDPRQGIESALEGRRWKASPATRMVELLRGTGVRLGLVTNGEQWMLVHVPPKESVGFASWFASLWLDEPLTLRAFHTLLGARRLFGVAETETLEALLSASAHDQQEVTDRLGLQVRSAVEVLVHALDRIDRDRGRKVLVGVEESAIYEAALAVMMRLVFLFSSEERGLLLLGDPLYDENYAVSTLGAQLREAADRHGEEVLERRCDAWARLLATFRAVFGGVEHDAMRLPAYGGALFDPDRHPFLEGRPPGSSWRDTRAEPLPVHNRTVLHLLEALQVLQVKVPGGGPREARRLSFRSLDIEQIGHVYEGLLDHTARRALRPDAPVLGLAGAGDKEPEIPLPRLERLRTEGQAALVSFLRDETGRSEKALNRDVVYEPTLERTRKLQTVCVHEPGLYDRVRPWAGLIRDDTEGYPLVIADGSAYVTRGTDRRSTGTHYTPRSLTEPIVRYTLEPLAYEGPAEGRPKEQWTLKSARDLLKLRVCDMAMGSGAFLVQACRYLSERLVESWDEAERAHPGRVVITPEGDLSNGSHTERPIPRDIEERLAVARRFVADRCLYGVDLNPTAVEMAKLSLWLVTQQKGRPFSFLDHALRPGDSLLGLTSVEQIERAHLDPERGRAVHETLFNFAEVCAPAFHAAVEKRRRLESFPVNDIRDAEEKARLFEEAQHALDEVRLIGDLIVSAAISTMSEPPEIQNRRIKLLVFHFAGAIDRKATAEERKERLAALREEATDLLGRDPGGRPRRPFHWPIEFPEVFVGDEGGGFDAVIGNPPFVGGQRITGILGTDYRHLLVEHVAHGRRGSADLCAYFFLRARELLRDGGGFGLLATNTIAQGDTREVGLDQLTAGDCAISRAVPSRKWPGDATLEVAHVWLRRGGWKGPHVLEDAEVAGITPFLTVPGAVEGKPFRLVANEDKSFQGSIVLGMGFVMTPDEAQELIARDPRNKDVLFPYLNGEDLNSRPGQSASRWVINFHDWPLDRSAPGRWLGAREDETAIWLGNGVVPGDYPGPVAADYPECLRIVEERVKPERTRKKPDGSLALRYPLYLRWWIYGEKRPKLYATIAGLDRVLTLSLVNNHLAFALASATTVFAHKLVVFPDGNWSPFAVLQSQIHYHWAWSYSSTMRNDINYSPSDCFETYPFPATLAGLDAIGEKYYETRAAIMKSAEDGLTKTYNRVHDPQDRAADLSKLRQLQVDMDRSVAGAYGWTDLDLSHGFHTTKQGLRFTISEPARREVLARLLELNHRRHAEELEAGLVDQHGRRRTKPKKAKKQKTRRPRTTSGLPFES